MFIHLEFKKVMFSVAWNNSEEAELEEGDNLAGDSPLLGILIKAGK